jgi:CRP/FNR family transcriptional regulator
MLIKPLEFHAGQLPVTPSHPGADTSDAAAPLARSHCSRCNLRAWCLPSDLASQDLDCMDSLIFGRRRIKTGHRLYGEGESFKYLYEVRSGNLKSSLKSFEGLERVSAFHMAGELVGLDGLADGQHASSATALEDTEVCAVSYEFLTELTASNAELSRILMQLMSREIVRERRLKVLLATANAEQKLANFLLNQSQQLSARGYSPKDFRLRMTRSDIGSYLGLTLATVSRTFSALQQRRLLEVDQRHIRITDLDGLTRVGDVGPLSVAG